MRTSTSCRALVMLDSVRICLMIDRLTVSESGPPEEDGKGGGLSSCGAGADAGVDFPNPKTILLVGDSGRCTSGRRDAKQLEVKSLESRELQVWRSHCGLS